MTTGPGVLTLPAHFILTVVDGVTGMPMGLRIDLSLAPVPVTGPSIMLSASSVAENAANGAIGTLSVSGGSGSYTFTETADPDSKFGVSGTTLSKTAAMDYETATSHSVTVQADNGVDTPLSRAFTITVTNVLEAGTLATLTLDDSSHEEDASRTTNIVSATSGSTITVTSGALPTGMTLNSGARTITGTPTTPGTYNFTLTETLSDAVGSPKATALSITITASSGATISYLSTSGGQSNGTGVGDIADLNVGYQFANTAVKFAVTASAGTYQTLNTVDPSTEYNSAAISHITGEMDAIAGGYGGAMLQWLWVKEPSNGTPISGTAPGGNLWNKADFNLRETIAATIVAAGDARVHSHALAQGEAEAETAASDAQTATASTAQAVVMPVALGTANPATGTGSNPLWAWAAQVAEHRRATREYHGILTAPYIILPYVLPHDGVYGDNAERVREAQRQNAINLGRKVTYNSGTDTVTIHAAANEKTVGWNTGTDAPTYTDEGAPSPYYDANTYYIDYIEPGSPATLHWSEDAQALIGHIKELLLKAHYSDAAGVAPTGNRFTRIRPVWQETLSFVSLTATSVTMAFTPSEDGTAHIGAYTPGSPVPTEAQVVAGSGTGFISKTTATASRRSETQKTFTGLSASTAYDFYAVIDYGGNYSVVSLDVFGDALSATTSAAAAAPSIVLADSEASGGAMTLTYSAAVNDWAYLFVATSDEPVATPSGWTLETTSTTGNTGTVGSAAVARLQKFGKLIAGGDPGSVVVADGGSWQAAAVVIVSGADTAAPIDVTATSNTDGTTSQVINAGTAVMIFPAVTTTVADTRVIMAMATSQDSATSPLANFAGAGLSGFAVVGEICTAASNGGGLHIVSGTKATAGSTGTATADLTTLNTGMAAITFAVSS